VRTHIRSVLVKTGTKRQAQLIAKMLEERSAPPNCNCGRARQSVLKDTGFLLIRSAGIVKDAGGCISDEIGNFVGPSERQHMDGRAG
jgi:hypothetical protein